MFPTQNIYLDVFGNIFQRILLYQILYLKNVFFTAFKCYVGILGEKKL